VSEYGEKLKDPRWQKKRLELLNRDKWTCQVCLSEEHTLHIHHRRYVKELLPWEYPDHMMVTLCEFCHANEGEQMFEAIKELIFNLKDAGIHSHQVRNLTSAFKKCYQKGDHISLIEPDWSDIRDYISKKIIRRGRI
jgi:5-methylcytosine-specific restriction endonuclease McrA